MEKTIYLASANPDKVEEIRSILVGVALSARPSDLPDVEETGDTLVENARLKAVALVDALGEAALSDDTGLEVDALLGAPGVRSARYAGDSATYADNVEKLLRALHGVPIDKRTARFRTVALLRHVDGSEVIAEGVVEGHIAQSGVGKGWGYDPVFVPSGGAGLTFGQMSSAEKNAISHRGRAFREMHRLLSR